MDLFVEDAWRAVLASDVGQLDLPPGRKGQRLDGVDHLNGAAPEGDESDAELVEAVEVGVGGEFGIEDKFLGQVAGTFLPEIDEAQDFRGLVGLSYLRVGIAEDITFGVPSQEGEQAVLAAAAFGNVVFFD